MSCCSLRNRLVGSGRGRLGELDLVDPDPQEILPVPVRPPVHLALLGLEDPDLGAADGPHQGGADQRALDQRAAHPEAPLALAADHEDAVETDRVPVTGRNELDVEHVSGGHPVLLATTLDHCVHKRSSPSQTKTRGRQTLPRKEGSVNFGSAAPPTAHRAGRTAYTIQGQAQRIGRWHEPTFSSGSASPLRLCWPVASMPLCCRCSTSWMTRTRRSRSRSTSVSRSSFGPTAGGWRRAKKCTPTRLSTACESKARTTVPSSSAARS